jgi:hypothetical protein
MNLCWRCGNKLCLPWQAEVYQFHFPIFGKKNVTAFHIAMHHVVFIEVDQNLLNERQLEKAVY